MEGFCHTFSGRIDSILSRGMISTLCGDGAMDSTMDMRASGLSEPYYLSDDR
jgi:hypothetical protein